MQDNPIDERQSRIAAAACALAADALDTSVWTRPDGSVRTDFRRMVRGLRIEMRREWRPWQGAWAAREGWLRVTDPHAGDVFLIRLNGDGVPVAVIIDVPGAWETVILGGQHGLP